MNVLNVFSDEMYGAIKYKVQLRLSMRFTVSSECLIYFMEKIYLTCSLPKVHAHMRKKHQLTKKDFRAYSYRSV